MKAILFDKLGDPDVLYLGETPSPICGPDEVKISVVATSVNRADLLQRRGLYPPPLGASSILGLEAAGIITEVGDRVSGWKVGQPVMALLAGGGYAEEVVVPFGQVMEIPSSLTFQQAASIPEAYVTAYLNLFLLGQLPFDQEENFPSHAFDNAVPRVLIHGGASGVGTAAISLCRENGFMVGCTVGSKEGEEQCKKLGAHFVWNYHQGDFSEFILSETQGQGVHVILDCIGAKYLASNLKVLSMNGRLVCIGLQGGSQATINLEELLDKRAQIIGSTLRNLPISRKTEIIKHFRKQVLPWFVKGRLTPILDRVFPLAQANQAHRALEGPHFGKIGIQVSQK